MLRRLRRLRGHWRHAVRVVRVLPPLVLLLLGIEGRWRTMVVCVGVGVHRGLHRRAILILLLAVVLLLAARLFVVWDRVARAHVVIIHGDGGE